MQCARWIKLYNKPIIKRRDPSSIPTVLLITTENSTEESVTRLFNMSVGDKPLNEYAPEDAVKQFKSIGHMNLKDSDVDIVIQYYANNELSTEDLYGIINDLEDDNREVVALVFDYIKRIRPAEPTSDERIQLKNVSNELKTLAIKFDIPVITANQINRAGNMAIDAAAGAIKRIKMRYKDLARYQYINHPFVKDSTIQLIDDIKMDKPLSILSISSDMVGANMTYGSKGSKSAKDRESVSTMERVDAFDLDGSINNDL